MEERKEEDEDHLFSNSNSNSKSKSKSDRSSSKAQYYSQPLPPSSSSSLKHSAVRKNSLDDTAVISYDSSAGGPNSGRSLSYPHYAFNSSPPPSYHHHQYTSSEEICHPNSNLPPPIHPNQSSNVVSAGPPFMSRKPTSSFSSSNGVLTLERAMSEFGGAPGTLPEFVGAGGGTGIFRVPVRAAMHPGRPPALELRPHPLRETQYGSFLRTMASTDTQLWCGQESGLRFWNFTDVFDGWNGGSSVKKGDEECAPFYESKRGRTSPVMCMVVDEAMGFIWTGHKDGKIRSWKIGKVGDDLVEGDGGDGCSEDGGAHFRERLSWQAHRHPVLSMVISSYGNDSS